MQKLKDMIGCRVFFTLLLLAGCIVEASTNSIPKFKSGFDDAKIDENMPIGIWLFYNNY